MLHIIQNIIIVITSTIFLTILLPSCSPHTIPLIPPTSPDSPFYPQILEANNISTTSKNITLNRSHYWQWFLRDQLSSISIDAYSEVYQQKQAGYHVMDMYIGDPTQLMYGIFDTGSDIVWVQCDDRAGKGNYPYYNQTKSSTYKTVKCGDKLRCNDTSSIPKCEGTSDDCQFNIKYEDDTSASGVMATDIISFKPDWEIVHDFIFGCSVTNSDKMMSVIGASNSGYSLPVQLYPNNPQFSYCISDDLTKKNLIKFGPDADFKGDTVDMMINRYTNYYYIDVAGIKVNGENIDVKQTEFQMSVDGSRGVIIDSGTTLSTLTSVAFSALQTKIEEFLGPSTRKYWLFPICYPSSTFGKWWPKKNRPTIWFEFSDDYVFELAEERVWQKMPGSDMECLQFRRTYTHISILGYDMLYNVNLGFDPRRGLLSLAHTTCPTV